MTQYCSWRFSKCEVLILQWKCVWQWKYHPKGWWIRKKKINSENVIDSIDNQRNTDESASIQNGDCYHNNQKYPKIFSNGTF